VSASQVCTPWIILTVLLRTAAQSMDLSRSTQRCCACRDFPHNGLPSYVNAPRNCRFYFNINHCRKTTGTMLRLGPSLDSLSRTFRIANTTQTWQTSSRIVHTLHESERRALSPFFQFTISRRIRDTTQLMPAVATTPLS